MCIRVTAVVLFHPGPENTPWVKGGEGHLLTRSSYHNGKQNPYRSAPLIGEVKAEEVATAVGGGFSQSQPQRCRPRGADASVGQVVLCAGTALHYAIDMCTRGRSVCAARQRCVLCVQGTMEETRKVAPLH